MALSSGSLCLWSDIKTLYSNTSNQGSRFDGGTISAPDQPTLVKPGYIKQLSDYLQGIKNNRYIRNAGYTIPTVDDYSTGSLIYPTNFNSIQSIVDTLSGICTNDSPNYSSRNSKDSANEGGYTLLKCPSD